MKDSLLLLISGEYKTGKTISACTFPKPLLLIDYDDGMESVNNAKGKDGKLIISDKDEITQVKFFKNTVNDLSFKTDMKGMTAPAHTKASIDLISSYNKIIKEIDDTGMYQNKKYETIVIDSLTTMFRIWKEAIMAMNNISALRIPDYGTLETVLYGQFIPSLKTLLLTNKVKYIILVDHTDTERDEITGAISEFPIGPSKNMGKNMGIAFDEIYRQRIEGDKYIWRTRKTGFFMAGSRLNVPDGIEANFNNLKQYIGG